MLSKYSDWIVEHTPEIIAVALVILVIIIVVLGLSEPQR